MESLPIEIIQNICLEMTIFELQNFMLTSKSIYHSCKYVYDKKIREFHDYLDKLIELLKQLNFNENLYKRTPNELIEILIRIYDDIYFNYLIKKDEILEHILIVYSFILNNFEVSFDEVELLDQIKKEKIHRCKLRVNSVFKERFNVQRLNSKLCDCERRKNIEYLELLEIFKR